MSEHSIGEGGILTECSEGDPLWVFVGEPFMRILPGALQGGASRSFMYTRFPSPPARSQYSGPESARESLHENGDPQEIAGGGGDPPMHQHAAPSQRVAPHQKHAARASRTAGVASLGPPHHRTTAPPHTSPRAGAAPPTTPAGPRPAPPPRDWPAASPRPPPRGRCPPATPPRPPAPAPGRPPPGNCRACAGAPP